MHLTYNSLWQNFGHILQSAICTKLTASYSVIQVPHTNKEPVCKAFTLYGYINTNVWIIKVKCLILANYKCGL